MDQDVIRRRLRALLFANINTVPRANGDTHIVPVKTYNDDMDVLSGFHLTKNGDLPDNIVDKILCNSVCDNVVPICDPVCPDPVFNTVGLPSVIPPVPICPIQLKPIPSDLPVPTAIQKLSVQQPIPISNIQPVNRPVNPPISQRGKETEKMNLTKLQNITTKLELEYKEANEKIQNLITKLKHSKDTEDAKITKIRGYIIQNLKALCEAQKNNQRIELQQKAHVAQEELQKKLDGCNSEKQALKKEADELRKQNRSVSRQVSEFQKDLKQIQQEKNAAKKELVKCKLTKNQDKKSQENLLKKITKLQKLAEKEVTKKNKLKKLTKTIKKLKKQLQKTSNNQTVDDNSESSDDEEETENTSFFKWSVFRILLAIFMTFSVAMPTSLFTSLANSNSTAEVDDAINKFTEYRMYRGTDDTNQENRSLNGVPINPAGSDTSQAPSIYTTANEVLYPIYLSGDGTSFHDDRNRRIRVKIADTTDQNNSNTNTTGTSKKTSKNINYNYNYLLSQLQNYQNIAERNAKAIGKLSNIANQSQEITVSQPTSINSTIDRLKLELHLPNQTKANQTNISQPNLNEIVDMFTTQNKLIEETSAQFFDEIKTITPREAGLDQPFYSNLFTKENFKTLIPLLLNRATIAASSYAPILPFIISLAATDTYIGLKNDDKTVNKFILENIQQKRSPIDILMTASEILKKDSKIQKFIEKCETNPQYSRLCADLIEANANHLQKYRNLSDKAQPYLKKFKNRTVLEVHSLSTKAENLLPQLQDIVAQKYDLFNYKDGQLHYKNEPQSQATQTIIEDVLLLSDRTNRLISTFRKDKQDMNAVKNAILQGKKLSFNTRSETIGFDNLELSSESTKQFLDYFNMTIYDFSGVSASDKAQQLLQVFTNIPGLPEYGFSKISNIVSKVSQPVSSSVSSINNALSSTAQNVASWFGFTNENAQRVVEELATDNRFRLNADEMTVLDSLKILDPNQIEGNVESLLQSFKDIITGDKMTNNPEILQFLNDFGGGAHQKTTISGGLLCPPYDESQVNDSLKQQFKCMTRSLEYAKMARANQYQVHPSRRAEFKHKKTQQAKILQRSIHEVDKAVDIIKFVSTTVTFNPLLYPQAKQKEFLRLSKKRLQDLAKQSEENPYHRSLNTRIQAIYRKIKSIQSYELPSLTKRNFENERQ